jgi:hypothetical protein
MTNPKEIAKSELGKIIFHLWQDKNHQRNESTPALHNISWSEDFAEAIIDALGLEFVSDDKEVIQCDTIQWELKGITPYPKKRLTKYFYHPIGKEDKEWLEFLFSGANEYKPKIIRRNGKPVVNIKEIKNE